MCCYLPPVVLCLCRWLHAQTLNPLATVPPERTPFPAVQCGHSCRPQANAFFVLLDRLGATVACVNYLNLSWANIGMIRCNMVSAAEQLSPQTMDGYLCTARVTSLSTVASSRSFPTTHVRLWYTHSDHCGTTARSSPILNSRHSLSNASNTVRILGAKVEDPE